MPFDRLAEDRVAMASPMQDNASSHASVQTIRQLNRRENLSGFLIYLFPRSKSDICIYKYRYFIHCAVNYLVRARLNPIEAMWNRVKEFFDNSTIQIRVMGEIYMFTGSMKSSVYLYNILK